ncbi:MAG: hypothetical protein JST28_09405 [Acidobacteria bacterium]|nr:hypothetical protein [Acidobacteriota bacterium]
MPTDPVEEWRRLSTLYSEMGDIEIEELANQISDLTPNAQEILREELKKRGITAGAEAKQLRTPFDGSVPATHWVQEYGTAADREFDPSGKDGVLDYTWKVALCRCESIDEAAARSEMLRRAGIDSWIQRPGARFVVPWTELGVGDIQINVGADQLDHARVILEQPIPQDIIDQLHEEASTPQYELPTCPKCGAPDPTLESVEPSNNWLCESCDHTWSDPIPDKPADSIEP